MALTPNDQQRYDELVEAAAVLKKSKKHQPLAEAVEYVLSPRGADFIGRLRDDRLQISDEKLPDPNLPIRMPETLRDEINRMSAASRTKLTLIVDRGFIRFLDGAMDVRVRPRASSKGGEPAVVLNVRPNGELHARVSAECRRRAEEGQSPRLHVSTVAAAALYEHFGIGPYAPGAPYVS